MRNSHQSRQLRTLFVSRRFYNEHRGARTACFMFYKLQRGAEPCWYKTHAQVQTLYRRCILFYLWCDIFSLARIFIFSATVFFGAPFFSLARLSSLVRLIFSLAPFFSPIKNYDKHYFVERLIHLIEEHSLLIITEIQASGVIIDRLLRRCCFVWSEIVGPYSSGNFNN